MKTLAIAAFAGLISFAACARMPEPPASVPTGGDGKGAIKEKADRPAGPRPPVNETLDESEHIVLVLEPGEPRALPPPVRILEERFETGKRATGKADDARTAGHANADSAKAAAGAKAGGVPPGAR